MKLKYFLFFILLISPGSYSNTLIKLKDGANHIDLNNSGSMDIIFLASFENNTSHPNHTATVFMMNDKKWTIIPTPDDNGFIWSDFSLSASMTKITDFELHKYNNNYYMIKGIKISDENNQEDLTDDTKIRFTRYKIASNNIDPGVPNLYWKLTGSYVTNEKYLNVDEAFKSLDMKKFK